MRDDEYGIFDRFFYIAVMFRAAEVTVLTSSLLSTRAKDGNNSRCCLQKNSADGVVKV